MKERTYRHSCYILSQVGVAQPRAGSRKVMEMDGRAVMRRLRNVAGPDDYAVAKHVAFWEHHLGMMAEEEGGGRRKGGGRRGGGRRR